MRLAVLAAGLPAVFAFGPRGEGTDPQHRFEFSRVGMGTEFRIVLYATDSLEAREAAASAFERIADLDQRLSDYRPDSELNRLGMTAGKDQAVRVSGDLWTVLAEAQRWAHRTGGAFDVTIGPLTRLWRWARRRGQLPLPDRLATSHEPVGYTHLRLDSLAHSVTLERPGMRLDLGGIAKGYAADAALAVLRDRGVPRALIDAGGDVVAGDPPPGQPGEPGWRVEISGLDDEGRPTREVRLLTRAAIATSGPSNQSLEADGVRYSHIVDPRTGLGLTHDLEVTVFAPTGMQADALASAISVLGPDEGLDLAEKTPGVEARLLVPGGDRFVLWETSPSGGLSPSLP
jgi:thiamine biosynthesis lipoprotein